MTTWKRKAIISSSLAGLAVLTAACTTDAKVEVTNGCGETVTFAHFEEDKFAPEFRDEMFAEVEWVTMKPGDSTQIRLDASSEPTAMITVVAEDADRTWDPVVADVQLEDPDDWHSGTLELTGSLCNSVGA